MSDIKKIIKLKNGNMQSDLVKEISFVDSIDDNSTKKLNLMFFISKAIKDITDVLKISSSKNITFDAIKKASTKISLIEVEKDIDFPTYTIKDGKLIIESINKLERGIHVIGQQPLNTVIDKNNVSANIKEDIIDFHPHLKEGDSLL